MTSGFHDVNNTTVLIRDILTSESLSFPATHSNHNSKWTLMGGCRFGHGITAGWRGSIIHRQDMRMSGRYHSDIIHASVRLISTDMTEWCRVDIKLMSGRGQPDIRIFCLCRVTETTWSHLNGAIKTINSTAIHHESPEETNDRYEKFIKKPLQNLYRNFYEKSI